MRSISLDKLVYICNRVNEIHRYMDNLYIFLSISVLGNLFIFFIYVLLRSYATNGIEGRCEGWRRVRVTAATESERGMVERGGWF